MRYISYCISIFLLLFFLSSCGSESTPVYNLTTTPTPNEAGSVSPSSGEYDEGEAVEITANPNADWLFDGWEGDASGSDNPTTVTMDGDKDIAATFVLREYSLTIEIEGEGTVKEEVVQGKTTDYEAGTVVELTANPVEGWTFVEWQGDITGSETPSTLTVDEAKEVTAVFERMDYPLTVNIEGEGAVKEEVVQGKTTDYEAGTVVELTANPVEGWTFVEWQGDITGSENPSTLTVDEAKEVTAVFERMDYPLTVNIEGEGTVKEEVVQGKTTDYPFETMVQLTSKPTDGWVFIEWNGDLVGEENPQTFEINEGKNVTSTFKSIDELLTIEIIGEGTVNIQQESFEDNPSRRSLLLTSKPDDGWVLFEWSGDEESTDEVIEVTVDSVKKITVNFYKPVYLNENKVTIMCPNGRVGDIGIVNGVKYEVVDTNLLTQRRNDGSDLSKVCTSLLKNMNSMFNNSEFNQPIGNWDVSNVTTMSRMFENSDFNQNIGSWDVSSVTDMSGMFRDTPFNQPIQNWDVSNVKDMSRMFGYTPINQPIEKWDVSSVTDMSEMFRGARFVQPIDNWNVSNVKDMSNMFFDTEFNEPIGEWNVSSVTTMRSMFGSSKFDQSIDNWDVSSVKDMSVMFSRSQFNQEISSWNVSSVTTMRSMFDDSKFNHDISLWNVSSVTDMSYMFSRSQFNQEINSWNVSSVTDMSFMFSRSQFNHDISSWNVGSVTTMKSMFNSSKFNQPINNWDVRNVKDMSRMFKGSQFNQPINDWNVGNVTNMSEMFHTENPFSRTNFNQPLDDWDVSSVTDMSFMFSRSQFNQPIGDWNVGNVKTMRSMFQTTDFNQNISDWCVSNITSEPENFSTDSPLSRVNKPVWGTCPGTPSVITLDSPVDSATDVSLTPELSWLVDDYATIYQVQVFEGGDPMVVNETTASTSYEITESLKSDTTYNWRVRGINEDRDLTGDWSEMWSFTTVD